MKRNLFVVKDDLGCLTCTPVCKANLHRMHAISHEFHIHEQNTLEKSNEKITVLVSVYILRATENLQDRDAFVTTFLEGYKHFGAWSLLIFLF